MANRRHVTCRLSARPWNASHLLWQNVRCWRVSWKSGSRVVTLARWVNALWHRVISRFSASSHSFVRYSLWVGFESGLMPRVVRFDNGNTLSMLKLLLVIDDRANDVPLVMMVKKMIVKMKRWQWKWWQ